MPKPCNPPEKALFPLCICSFSILYSQTLAKICTPLKAEQEAKTRVRTHFQNVEQYKITTITCLSLLTKIIRKNEDIAELGRGSLHWKKFCLHLFLCHPTKLIERAVSALLSVFYTNY